MIVLVKDVEIGVYLRPKIYDFWVTVVLKSGKEIRIFDSGCLDLRPYVGQKLDLLTFAAHGSVDSDESYDLEGIYFKNYKLPTRWLQKDGSLGIWKKSAIKTKNGIFLINDLDYYKYENLRPIRLEIWRYDLEEFLPIEKEWNDRKIIILKLLIA